MNRNLPFNQKLEELNQISDIRKRLYKLVQLLRTHCPWDQKQTLESLRHSLLEEAYEVIQGVDEPDKQKKIKILKEELGDLLFLVHFYIYLCEEQNFFSIEELYQSAIDKLVERHPHVFGNLQTKDSEQVLRNWEAFKKKELGENTEFLPALMRADKIQKKASLEGFDWQKKDSGIHLKEIIQTLKEEIQELEKEIQNHSSSKIEEEIGDMLFSMVNLARHLHVSSEIALHKSSEKFIRRFRKIKEIYHKNYQDNVSLEEKHKRLEEIYKKIKQDEI